MSRSSVYFGNINFSLGISKNIEELPDLKNEELQEMKSVGLGNYLSSNLSSFELGEDSLKKTLSSSNIPPEKIDAVVWQVDDSSSKKEDLDSFCTILVRNNILNATPVGISLTKCSTSVMAMQTATGLIRNFGYNNILVVMCQKWDEISRALGTQLVASDGASSFIVSRDMLNYEILDFSITTDLRIFVHQDLSQFANAYTYSLNSAIHKLLSKSGIKMENISRVFHFNGSFEFHKTVFQYCGIDVKLGFFDNLSKHAHVCASDQVINIYDSERKQPMKKNDIFILIGTSKVSTSLALLKKAS